MDDIGTMMRTPKREIAEKYDLAFITIKQLQDYLRINEARHVIREAVLQPPTIWRIHNKGILMILLGEHHVAFVKGEIGDGKDASAEFIRSASHRGYAFGSLRCIVARKLEKSLR